MRNACVSLFIKWAVLFIGAKPHIPPDCTVLSFALLVWQLLGFNYGAQVLVYKNC